MFRRPIPLLVLGLAALPSAVSAAPKALTSSPIKDFRMPLFTEEGFREIFIRAGEARLPDPDRVDATEVEVTLFDGKADEMIDLMLAAPSATLFPRRKIVVGADTVRLERLDLTVTGSDWSYDHQARKIIINRDAYVRFHAPIGDILK